MLSTSATKSAAEASAKPLSIRVYNTLSRTKEPFEPLIAGSVRIYLCGPTVYKPSHIGHMVGPVIFDTIKRFLVYCGYNVTFVINITDIDDKLINEAANRKITVAELATEMTADYMANLAAMGVTTIDHFPKATDHIGDILDLTQALIDKGFAYATSSGDVYFDVTRDHEYGKLSRRTIDSMQGEGGEMAERKRNAADFALWKSAKPGEPSWPSPWGPGRPGWHIECSAMSRKILGESFDIHGGGLDLIFPHHENEIAQSECCHGAPQAKYWLHNGLMQASDEVGKVGGRNTRAAGDADQQQQEAGKMGKSKGASAFSALLQRFRPETIRFFLLSTHYRRPISYGEDRLRETDTSLEGFYRFFKRYQRVAGESFYDVVAPARRAEGTIATGRHPALETIAQLRDRFLESMDDDFNTGGAMGDLFELLRALNKLVDEHQLETASASKPKELEVLKQGVRTLRELSSVLGLFQKPVEPTAQADDQLVGGVVKLLLEARAHARGAKDFALADQVRNGLTACGVILEDRPQGTEWSAPGAPPEIAPLMAQVIEVRSAARKAKNFKLADTIRDGLASLRIVLEDRPDKTEWTVQSG